MKFKPSSEQLEKIFNPAYEDIMAICDEMDFETKCGNEFIIKFLEDIVAVSYTHLTLPTTVRV